jgi:hypothetical protein
MAFWANLPIDEITKLYYAGASARDLAKQYNVTDNTIRAHLRKANVKLRTLSQAQSLWLKGLPKTIEHRRKLSESKKGKPAPKPKDFGKKLSLVCSMRGCFGNKHPAWRGGTTPLRNTILRWSVYKEWRTAIYERDQYICQRCYQRGGDLAAHHLRPLMDIFREYNIKTPEDALGCIALWDINNGQTLCRSCHATVEREIWLSSHEKK